MGIDKADIQALIMGAGWIVILLIASFAGAAFAGLVVRIFGGASGLY